MVWLHAQRTIAISTPASRVPLPPETALQQRTDTRTAMRIVMTARIPVWV